LIWGFQFVPQGLISNLPALLYITEADPRILLKHTFGQTSSTIDPLQLKERLLRGGWEAMAEQPWRTRKAGFRGGAAQERI